MEMTHLEQFKKDSYLALEKVIPIDLCRIATKYALMKEETEFTPEDPNAQVPGAHSVYGDTFMETMMSFLLPHMEKYTGLELAPTYTYYRVYRPGVDLARHKDRESCEISTTICLGYKYLHNDPNYSWGMYVDKDSVGLNPPRGFVSAGNPGKMVAQQPGDLIIYRGCEVEHWRDKFDANYGSYQVQAFFHYIDKNGPYYPKFKFDGRPSLGRKAETRRGINN